MFMIRRVAKRLEGMGIGGPDEHDVPGRVPIFWSDCGAKNPPTKEFGPTIAFDVAFDGEQHFDSAFDQRHFCLSFQKKGLHPIR